MKLQDAIELYNDAEKGEEHEMGRRYIAEVIFSLAKEELDPEADKQQWNMVNHFDPMEVSEAQLNRIISMLEA